MKIGVLAGTPVDTAMGAKIIRDAGFEPVGRSCSETPEQQNLEQILNKSELFEHVLRLCSEMKEEGAAGIFLYCNSLAGALDMDKLRLHASMKIISPLDVYDDLARKYKRIAVISANGQSLAAIERVLQAANPGCTVYGCGLMPLVYEIEAGVPPEELAEKVGISDMVRFLSKLGGEILLLGCTHFPYLKEQITAVSEMPVIDPAADMLRLLID